EVECVVENALRDILLPVVHEIVNEFCESSASILGIGSRNPSSDPGAPWHWFPPWSVVLLASRLPPHRVGVLTRTEALPGVTPEGSASALIHLLTSSHPARVSTPLRFGGD